MHFSFFELDVFSESISLLQDTDTLGAIADWMTSNLLCLNSSKTEFLLLGPHAFTLNKYLRIDLIWTGGAGSCINCASESMLKAIQLSLSKTCNKTLSCIIKP